MSDCAVFDGDSPKQGRIQNFNNNDQIQGRFDSAWFALSMSKLRVYADNEKVRALIQKIKDQSVRADKRLRKTR